MNDEFRVSFRDTKTGEAIEIDAVLVGLERSTEPGQWWRSIPGVGQMEIVFGSGVVRFQQVHKIVNASASNTSEITETHQITKQRVEGCGRAQHSAG